MKVTCSVVASVLVFVSVAVVLFPVFASARVAASRTNMLSNVKECGEAVVMYTADFDDIFPFVTNSEQVGSLCLPYRKNDKSWETMNQAVPGPFEFNPCLPGVSAADNFNAAETPMIFDPFSFELPRDGDFAWSRRTLAFADGHAKGIFERDWSKYEDGLHLDLKKHGKPLD